MPPINSFDCPLSAVEKGADMKSRQPQSFVVELGGCRTSHLWENIKPTLLANQIRHTGNVEKAANDNKRPIMPKRDQ